jgi:hypothetical protein
MHWCETLSCTYKYFLDWQTLIAGLIAIGAAFIGGQFIHKQIRASERLEENRRRRKFAAARSVLPLALSALSDYARRCAVALKAIYAQRDDESILKQINLPEFPSLPGAIIEDLRVMIEFGDDALYDVLATLLEELQVQTARLNDLWGELRTPGERSTTVSNIVDYILDTAFIYARAAALFDFARRKSEAIPGDPSYEQIMSALNQTGFLDEEFDRIREAAGRQFGARLGPAETVSPSR